MINSRQKPNVSAAGSTSKSPTSPPNKSKPKSTAPMSDALKNRNIVTKDPSLVNIKASASYETDEEHRQNSHQRTDWQMKHSTATEHLRPMIYRTRQKSGGSVGSVNSKISATGNTFSSPIYRSSQNINSSKHQQTHIRNSSRQQHSDFSATNVSNGTKVQVSFSSLASNGPPSIDEIFSSYQRHQRQYRSAPKLIIANRSTSGELLRQNQVNIKNTSTAGRSGIPVQQETTTIRQMLSIESGMVSLTALGRDREVTTSYTESLDQILRDSADGADRSRQNLANRMSIVREETDVELPVPNNLTIQPAIAITSPNRFPSSSDTSPNNFEEDGFGFIQYNSTDLLAHNQPKRKQAKIVGPYVLGDMLGEGSYGKVKEGFCIETLRRCAIKIMRHQKLKKIPNGELNVKREIALLKRLRHKNIVELMDVIFDTEKQKIYVVFEYCAATVSDLMEQSPTKKLPLSQAQRYFRHLIKGLQYLHSHSVIHRDIKPSNLILSADDIIKVSDFGVAEEVSRYAPNDNVQTCAGTPAFQPPEAAAGLAEFSGFKADIWATGVTLFNMISGRYPFDGETTFVLFENIVKCDYPIPLEADSQLADLIYGIMEKNTETRLSLEQISSHTWLKLEFPWNPNEIVPVFPFIPVDEDISFANNHQPSKGNTGGKEENDERILELKAKRGHLSNPQFAHDTTLLPYLEMMFDDLPEFLRRSSVVDNSYRELKQQQQRRSKPSENLFRRISRSFQGDSTSPKAAAKRNKSLLAPGQK